MEEVIQNFKKQPLLMVNLLLFIGLSAWWIYINFFFPDVTREDKQLFAACYQILALFGAITGFWIAKRWGGYKSLLGKALSLFSLGLLLQSFGQSAYSYYIFFEKIEVPYPSIGDIGYFGSVMTYIAGIIYLARVAGFRSSWKILKNKVYLILIPIIILWVSYSFFLEGYEFDWSQKLKIFLDFGYPFGQAFYVSNAIATLVLSKDILGGIMRRPILFLIFALIIQYLSDFMFLYQANAGEWSAGGFNDYLYSISYFLMAVALIHIGSMFIEIKKS